MPSLCVLLLVNDEWIDFTSVDWDSLPVGNYEYRVVSTNGVGISSKAAKINDAKSIVVDEISEQANDDNQVLIDNLKQYQISPTLTDPMYDNNCLIYALIQSNRFDEKTINNMKAT